MTVLRRDRYGIYFSTYFTGPTGREIQAKGPDAVILGVYLGVNEHASMIGLYELPMLYVEYELPVLDSRARIRRAFRDLATLPSGPFAEYDEASAHVWVREMARVRLNLAPGRPLGRLDNRHRAVLALYDLLSPNPFLGAFYDHYQALLQLPERRPGAAAPAPPLLKALEERQGASEGMARGSEASDQYRDQ